MEGGEEKEKEKEAVIKSNSSTPEGNVERGGEIKEIQKKGEKEEEKETIENRSSVEGKMKEKVMEKPHENGIKEENLTQDTSPMSLKIINENQGNDFRAEKDVSMEVEAEVVLETVVKSERGAGCDGGKEDTAMVVERLAMGGDGAGPSFAQAVEGEAELKIGGSEGASTVVGVNEGLSDNSMSRLCCALILYGCPLQISPKAVEVTGAEVGFSPAVIPLSRLNVLGIRVHAPDTIVSSTETAGDRDRDIDMDKGGVETVGKIPMFDVKNFCKISGIAVTEKELSDFYRHVWLPFCCSIFKKNILLSHLYKRIIPSPMKKAADHHIATRGKYIRAEALT